MQHDQVIQVLNDPLAQELVNSSIPARVAYTARDGTPRVVPLGFYWDGAQFIICTVPRSPKVRALSVNPGVALTIDTVTFPPHVLLVRGTATLEEVDGVPDEFLKASAKQMGPEGMPAFEKEVRGLYKKMVRISVTPSWAKLLDFETRLPSPVEALLREQQTAPPG
ncbi:MAG: pyridoxamine 5'-phosphate oxidase family protein [Chloroflexi bacterium]|nr:pyridoxamine 5'-phosphate oxidase family protein [Chloroflexota bacterium]